MRIVTGSEEETKKAGFRLGTVLKRLSRGCTVFLYGEMGAGKTTFIKGFASAFGILEKDIGSASFVIVAEYETSPPFYHIDLYRINKAEDVDALGIWDYIDSDGIAVIEWAERLSEIPENAIKVRINYIDENSREIITEGVDEEDRHYMQGRKVGTC
ncbi:MAG: tRNA (adenosine(37)-N6)-threonylcarbamoyltransferase complex ATPase subunit type 1 TsaE [Thermodesulfovibrionales bacterium]|nr:tRNA (adenosine(37)-N6)-threonylcarbamoyltransferase complex ATPase subunit type 1 TsaE [Thermodesulfovibrionales bacterium]